MSNRMALILLVVVVALLGGDAVLNGGRATMFILRKFATFIEYLSFWR